MFVFQQNRKLYIPVSVIFFAKMKSLTENNTENLYRVRFSFFTFFPLEMYRLSKKWEYLMRQICPLITHQSTGTILIDPKVEHHTATPYHVLLYARILKPMGLFYFLFFIELFFLFSVHFKKVSLVSVLEEISHI